LLVLDRVARWYIFKAKNPDLGKFWKGLAVEDVCILYIWLLPILWVFGIIFPFGNEEKSDKPGSGTRVFFALRSGL
jgi:hypothetical protein